MMEILAFIPPILIGTAIIVMVFPKSSQKAAWAVFTVCLGSGIGLGITSATIFLWLAWFGRPGAAYHVFEVGSAIVLTIIAYYRFHYYQSGSQNESTPDCATNDGPIKWLKRLVIILPLISAGSFGLKASLQTIVLIGFTASCAAWTKNEGLVFFVWVILVRFIGQIGKSDWSNLIKEFFYFLLGMLPVMGTLLYFKLNFAPRNDTINIYHLKKSVVHLLDFDRYLIVLTEILKKVYFFNDKIVILMAVYFLISGLDRSGKVKKHLLSHVILLLLMLCGYIFAYVITPYDLRWHIDSSLRRLFIQLWPAWVFLFFYCVRGPEQSAQQDQPGELSREGL